MVGISEISAAFASLQAAKDIVGSIAGLRDANALLDVQITLRGTIIDAQSALLEAQQSQAAQTQRVADLEAEVARLKAWDRERERYVLAAPDNAGFVQSLKEAMAAGEPPHWACANCFANGKKSILQPVSASSYGGAAWDCNTCKQRIVLQQDVMPWFG